MLTPLKLATSSCQSVRPTVGSIIKYFSLLRSFLNSILHIPTTCVLSKNFVVKSSRRVSTSGAAVQLAVLPVWGGQERNLRPTKELTFTPPSPRYWRQK